MRRSLLWVVNLGSIDLNPWYARCDDADRPDYLHFDLDPTPGAGFQKVRKAALIVRDALAERKIVSYPKTTGPRGIHVYVPIARGPVQKQVWTFAKSVAKELEAKQSDNYRRISGRENGPKTESLWTTTRMHGDALWRRSIQSGRSPTPPYPHC
jgi:DNA primase